MRKKQIQNLPCQEEKWLNIILNRIKDWDPESAIRVLETYIEEPHPEELIQRAKKELEKYKRWLR